ncbi:hypothetical protein D5085_03480 [Ectothiorhodospiraceae bacterium BW-2]|nr:hypothetical protein D5085_03480 [Ectothiorhodospiraceae bacterium BW-2]
MIINNSAIAMQSQHTQLSLHQKSEQFHFWVDDARGAAPRALAATPPAAAPQRVSPPIELPPRTEQASRINHSGAVAEEEGDEAAPKSMEEWAYNMKASLVQMLVEKMTGKKMELFDANDLTPTKHSEIADLPAEDRAKKGESAANEREGWGMEYHYEESYFESEKSGFHAQGVVELADGRQINLDVQLEMSREYLTYESVSLKAGDALKDPLVLNLGGGPTSLSETERFNFDLDADGKMENIAKLTGGNVMLALDNNNDGRVNNGTELFGAISGDAYADLAAYDGDGNGWIDENDTIFVKLRLWNGDEQGNLSTLAQSGVGALYLGRQETPHRITDSNNDTLAQVRHTGLYLMESGHAGTMQQIDLKV